MKNHITKAIAVFMAVLMMMSLVPVAALPDFNLPTLLSVFGGTTAADGVSSDADADGTADVPTNDGTTSDGTATNAPAVVVGDESAIETEDGAIVANTNADGVYMSENGTLYMDADGDGMAEAISGDTVADEDIASVVTQGKVVKDEVYYAEATGLDTAGMVPKSLSAYEPTDTENENHPFLPGNAAWIDLSQLYYGAPATQNYPLTKWSANTSVYNITEYEGSYPTTSPAYKNGDKKYVFTDLDLIDGYTWAGYASDPELPNVNGSVSSAVKKDSKYNIVIPKNGNTAYAYNRYDAMQGKYGITLDKNVKSAIWQPSWYADYYGTEDLYNSVLYLSDTPYLYFSTEALDTTDMAISLLIGAPVQEEIGTGSGTQTYVKNTTYYEYRWYTITDNSERPGIGTDTLDNSMVPVVTISDVVAKVAGQNAVGDAGSNAYYQQTSAVAAAIYGTDYEDPVKMAGGGDELYVSGSITGCIDFTNLLPVIMGVDNDKDDVDKGREDVQYKVAQIRVDTKNDAGYDSACRINYMYFGPSLSTSFSPQNTVGSEVSGQAWQFKQTTTGDIGNGNTAVGAAAATADERAYTGGWENGAAVSYTNTPNDPQKLTVDIYGQGDGQLIEWSAVPSDANIIQGSSDSKVWKFTDTNGVVCYMEAEKNTVAHSGVDDVYYVMVTVPVRKWINVLGESRKISLTATLLQSGQVNSVLKPTFVLWGNEDGALGCGHSGRGYGSRFRNEDLITVFATDGQCYHCDEGNDYVAAEVDRTIGDSLIYNAPGGTTESWFDVLRSPYTYDETVTTTNATNGIGTQHIGYTFVTSLRFAMPVGSAIQIQNMKGEGNSAGLNMYSTAGNIVSAYDGGTGEHPEIDVSNTQTETQVKIDETSDSGYTYTTQSLGTINGTQTDGAAAYGPFLQQSYYTIYDMLDAEWLNAAGDNSHFAVNQGKNNMSVYGQMWYPYASQLPIYNIPDTNGTIYGYTYGTGNEFPVYATVKITDEGNEKWGLTGVVTESGTSEIGWVCLWDAYSDDQSDIPGSSSNNDAKASAGAGLLYGEYSATRAEATGYYFGRNIVGEMKNEWVLSNFINTYSDFQSATKGSFKHGIPNGSNYNPAAKDVYTNNYSTTQLMFANMWRNSSYGGTSTYKTLKDTTVRSVNGTDMEIGFTRVNNTNQNWSVGMTRTFDTPITLKQGPTNIHASYPVFYYDYTASNIADNQDSNMVGLTLLVDENGDGDTTDVDDWTTPNVDEGDGVYLYYLDLEGSSASNSLTQTATDGGNGSCYGYISFEDIMTKDFPGKTIQVAGLSLYYWRASGANLTSDTITVRRMEIWQEETDWLDGIIADNQQQGGNTSTAMNCQVKDSMNIINDAFFNYHDETKDGGYTIWGIKGDDGNGVVNTGTGINETINGYQFGESDNTTSEQVTEWEGDNKIQYQRTVSYRKSNSNKGWSARIMTDTNQDGVLNENDPTVYSYDQETDHTGIYEYRTSLGHLRVWVPSGTKNTDGTVTPTQASVVFESDRSFNVDNYKYLYYSYSMRDTATGIAAEEAGTGSGVSVAIKSQRLISDRTYIENGSTWDYYGKDDPYWSDQGYEDRRSFKTVNNVALDLSTLDGIDSVNQFVFYLSNATERSAEFYINYIYLSNVPPTELIANKLEETELQYYYLMDNTGDRYSARFPTIDNPTGAVTGTNADTDRVNPVIVNRGDRLSEGTYFNGDRLYGYGTLPDGATREYDPETESVGYYEKMFGTSEVNANMDSNGSFKNIWFYAGKDDDPDTYTDIGDIYTYKERNGDGEEDIYDMLWSYGRWYTGAGESGLNNMYVGNPSNLGSGDTADGVSGNLVRRYATENYVLLRSGIQPVKYQHYYDSEGGQFVYEASNEELKDGIQLDENSYYITQSVMYSTFTYPTFNATLAEPVKYGYTFKGWETTDDLDGNNNTNKKTVKTYFRKQQPDINYFTAIWEEDSAYDSVVNTANFYVGDEVWFTRTANRANQFKITLPNITQAEINGATTPIRGWRVKGDTTGKIYSVGQKIVLKDSVDMEPVTSTADSPEASLTMTAELHGAELYLVTEIDETTGKYKDVVRLNDYADSNNGGYHGIKVTKVDNNSYTYTNLPRDVVVLARPLTQTAGATWQIANDANTEDFITLNGVTGTVVSTDSTEYQFSMLTDIDLTYSVMTDSQPANYTDSNGALSTLMTSSSNASTENGALVREMIFVSRFDLSQVSGAEAVAWGTLYCRNATYGKLTDPYTQMCLNPTSITDTTVTTGAFTTMDTANVRQVKATSKNASNQYYLRVTENQGNRVQYYARSYVIYKLNGEYCVAYSNVILREYLPAATLNIGE